jgi:hypothetical protein
LTFSGLAIPQAVAGFSGTSFSDDEAIEVAEQPVTAGAAGQITVALQFPAGYHLNPRAPLTYNVDVQGTGITIAAQDRQGHTIAPPLPLTIPFQAAAGEHRATVDIAMTFYYCREDDAGVCVIQPVRWHVPLRTVMDDSAVAPVVSYQAEAPVIQKQL